MKARIFALMIALSIGCGIAAEALAQAKPAQLVAQRKGAMNLQVKYYFPMLAMVQGRAPYDAAIVQRNADYLAVLSQLPWDDFQPGTAGAPNTKAKEDIYKDPAKFKSAVESLQVEVKNLVTAARGGDQAVVGAAVRNVGKSCNACHEGFADFEFRFKLQ